MTQKFICAHIETPEQIFTWLIANRDKISKGKLYNKRISLMIFASNGSVTFNTVAAYTDMPDDTPKDSLLKVYDALGNVFKQILTDIGNIPVGLSNVTVLGISNF